jgi:hypothetical protein
MDLPFLFRCRFTDRTAQGVTEADVLVGSPTTQYVGVICTGCHQLHIVNPQTGRLLSEEVDRRGRSTAEDSRSPSPGPGTMRS